MDKNHIKLSEYIKKHSETKEMEKRIDKNTRKNVENYKDIKRKYQNRVTRID